MSVALITGGSAGLGRALVTTLADHGWTVITDARTPEPLQELDHPRIHAIVGDVTDPTHQRALAEAVTAYGQLDLLVHNASTLGPTPMRPLAEADPDAARAVWATNLTAPLAITRSLLPLLQSSHGALVTISSDAAVEHYPTWGLYAASKAALDHTTLTLAAENPELRAYAVDPGDMRTAMHQAAFPGDDISDRPLPETVVPHLLTLIGQRPPSGRYRATDLGATPATAAAPAPAPIGEEVSA